MLTTRCPHCSSLFRIRPEQLSVRGGRVRCGRCRQAFSALASLEEYPDDDGQDDALPRSGPTNHQPPPASDPPASETPAAMPQAGGVAAPEARVQGVRDMAVAGAAAVVESGADALVSPQPHGGQAEEGRWVGEDRVVQPSPDRVEEIAAERFTLRGDIEDAPAPIAQRPPEGPLPELGVTGSDLSPEAAPASFVPYKSKIAEQLGIEPYDPAKDVPTGFTLLLEESVDESQRETGAGVVGSGVVVQDQIQSPRRASPWPWVGGILALGALTVAQVGYLFRADLARAVPAARPVLEALCQRAGCEVPYPRDAERIQVESTSLNPEPDVEGRFRLTVNLLNQAAYPQAWPYLELTLTDRFDQALARRILQPQEWLPSGQAGQSAFSAGDEVSGSAIVEAPDLPAVGYRVYAFYP